MKLTTNQQQIFNSQDSSDFSKYFLNEDRDSLYNYSHSCTNQTLLLQNSQLPDRKHMSKPRVKLLKNILQTNRQQPQPSILQNLYEQSNLTISKVYQMDCTNQNKKQKINQMYSLCQGLMCAINKLQSKMQKIENNQKQKQKSKCQKQSINFSQKQVESILTYSSMQSSKGSKCDQTHRKVLMNNFFQLMEYKTKVQMYKQENQNLKTTILKLQIANQSLKKIIKKNQAQNFKNKQLIKQYQNLNKKNINKIKQNEGNYENYSPQLSKLVTCPASHLSPKSYNSSNYCHSPNPLRRSNQPNEYLQQYLQQKYSQQQQAPFVKNNPTTPNIFIHRRAPTTTLKTEIKNQNASFVYPIATQFNNHHNCNRYDQNTRTVNNNILRQSYQRTSPRVHQAYPFRQMLQKQIYEIGQHAPKGQTLQNINTMSSLPDNCGIVRENQVGLNLSPSQVKGKSSSKGNKNRSGVFVYENCYQ